jgi:16S rRNA (cytidine1402-2'-O)-methyltransferase
MDDSETTGKEGRLYVVATPIGNQDDITLRALKILAQVDLVAAEDTRHTGRLLSFHKIKSHLISYHEHNEKERTPELIARLKKGETIALVSNAGTPSVSDPGYRLVKEAISHDIKIIPIPGVSAVIAALSVSGLPTDSFVFIGFPAKRKGKRLSQLKELVNEPRTIVFYESPKRILGLLDEIMQIMGDRYAVLSREVTKLHEEFMRGTVSEILCRLKNRPSIKGECTLLLTGCEAYGAVSIETIRNEIKKEMRTNESKLTDLSKKVAKKFGLAGNKVYEEALRIKRKRKQRV